MNIDIKDLYVSYTKEFDALHNLNLHIDDGQKIAIVGDSDSGKTTLLRVLAGLQPVSSGEVTINDTLINKVNFKQDVSLGYVPKVPVFKNKKTAFQNMQYVLKIRGYDEASMGFKIMSALKNFGVDGIKNVPIQSLTLHQKMLLQLARISMRKLDIILIDNITKNLNKEEQESIINAIKYLIDLNPNAILIFATDNEKVALSLDLEIHKIKLGSLEEKKK